MKRFKNKKLATIIVAFLMVFVLAGAFAALSRLLLLDARVNLFAPMVEVVWQDVSLYEGPPLWTAADPFGLGVPMTDPATGEIMDGLERFENRVWPAPRAGIPTALGYFETHAPAGWAAATRFGYAHAWWALNHGGTGQHAMIGQLPALSHITEMTLAEPLEYIHLSLGMVFDNLDQTYVFGVTMANPSAVPLITGEPIVRGAWVDAAEWEIYAADGYAGVPRRIVPEIGDFVRIGDPAASPHAAIIEVDVDGLEGVVLPAGGVATRAITFDAPADNWLDFFESYAAAGLFLDAYFDLNLQAFYAIEVPATIYVAGP